MANSFIYRLTIFISFLFTFCGAGKSLRSKGNILNRSLTTSNEIPKIAHYILLGDSVPEYMAETVRVNMDRIRSTGYQAKLWRDADAERLVAEYGDPAVSQAWQYIKDDSRQSRFAKMADFLRPLIMYMEGGVYLDTDMIPCGSLDYLIDDPYVVSFPFLYGGAGEVNGAAMSSAPGHPLMKLTLDAFIELGRDITILHNLDAAGPNRMAIVVDDYLRKYGLDVPHLFSSPSFSPYVDSPQYTSHYGIWTQIADLRFTHPTVDFEPPTYHLHFGSWIYGHDQIHNRCSEEPALIEGFINWMCQPDIKNHQIMYSDCGKHLR